MQVETIARSRTTEATTRHAAAIKGRRGFVLVNPRHEAIFTAKGLTSPEAFLNLPGEVVSGHPDRHVMQVRVPTADGATQLAYLKRQHTLRRFERTKNGLAGFGFVSKSVREARVLQHLEDLRIDATPWLAYGESADGRAFVLVENIAPLVELRTFLANPKLTDADRLRSAERIGQALAELHLAGVYHPETSAKHCFIDPNSLAVRFIDWQNARIHRRLTEAERTRSLAVLDASLHENLASDAERARVLWSYRRTLRASSKSFSLLRFSTSRTAIARLARTLIERRSIRDQRQCHSLNVHQRLVWLAGEAVCVVPDLVPQWPTPADGPLCYMEPQSPSTLEVGEVTFASGRRGVMFRRRSRARISRFLAWIRGRAWRSPELQRARLHFHLERYGIPAPTLLAFGQKHSVAGCIDSFLLINLELRSTSFEEWSAKETRPHRRARVFEAIGLLLRQLHDAGCRIELPLHLPCPLMIMRGRPLEPVMFADLAPLRLVKSVSDRDREADLDRLFRGSFADLTPEEMVAVHHGYFGEPSDES